MKILVLEVGVRGRLGDREIVDVESVEEYCEMRIEKFVEELKESGEFDEKFDDEYVGWDVNDEGVYEVCFVEDEGLDIYVLKS